MMTLIGILGMVLVFELGIVVGYLLNIWDNIK